MKDKQKKEPNASGVLGQMGYVFDLNCRYPEPIASLLAWASRLDLNQVHLDSLERLCQGIVRAIRLCRWRESRVKITDLWDRRGPCSLCRCRRSRRDRSSRKADAH